MKVVLAQIKGRNWWTWAWVPDEHPSCQVTEQQVFWRPTSPGGDSYIKAKGPLRKGLNTKHYVITTIRRTAAHLYHTMNHHRVQLPQGASITWCTYHTLHGSRLLNYLTVHRPKFFTYHKVHLWHGAPSTQCADPSTSCTYHTVHLPRGWPRFLNYHTVCRPKHFMHLPHSAPTVWFTQVPQLPHSVPTQALHAPTTQWYLVRYNFFLCFYSNGIK